MCHETSRHTEVEFAPELMMAGHSVTPTHVERRGRRTAVLPGPLTQNTLCRGWPEPESWLRCVCVGGEAGGSLEVVCICYRALAVLSVDSGPGVQLKQDHQDMFHSWLLALSLLSEYSASSCKVSLPYLKSDFLIYNRRSLASNTGQNRTEQTVRVLAHRANWYPISLSALCASVNQIVERLVCPRAPIDFVPVQTAPGSHTLRWPIIWALMPSRSQSDH